MPVLLLSYSFSLPFINAILIAAKSSSKNDSSKKTSVKPADAEKKAEDKKPNSSLLSTKSSGPESDYNPAIGTSYHPVDNACWKHGEK